MNRLIRKNSSYLEVAILSLSFIFISHLLNAQGFVERLRVPWDTIGGIKTEMTLSSNNGLLDFEMINSNAVAFLCDVEKKVKIFNLESKEMILEFSYNHDALGLTYDKTNNKFYIASYNKVYVYCAAGNLERVIDYDNTKIPSFFDIKELDGDVYFLASGQYSYNLIKDNKILNEQEQQASKKKGWLLNDGTISEYTGRVVNESIIVKLTKNNKTSVYTIKTDFNSGGLHTLGMVKDLLILKEYIEKGVIYSDVHCRLLIYSTVNQKIITSQDIPRIQYTYQRNDIKIFNNTIYQVITTPQNALLLEYKVTDLKSGGQGLEYPPELNYDYHYNYYLKVDSSAYFKSTGTDIDVGMRTEVLSRGYKYVSLNWKANKENFPLGLVSNQNVETDISTAPGYSGVTPYPVTVPNCVSTTTINEGMVYKWGGWTHYNCYNYFVGLGRVTGDITSGNCEESNNNVIGTDCSGFISRAWDLSSKHGTDNLPGSIVSSADWPVLKAGDILNKPGSHVRMVVKYTSDTEIEVMEATPGKVINHSLTRGDFYGYRGQRMPQYDNDYDLVYQSLDLSLTETGYLSGFVNIKNIGSEIFEGRIGISLYKLPAIDESKEYGEWIQELALEDFSISPDDEEILNIYKKPDIAIPGGYYKIRVEYIRDKDMYLAFEKQTIPYRDYKVKVNDLIVVNAYVIKGRLFKSIGQIPFVYKKLLVENSLKSVSDNAIEGVTDENGNFTIAVPNSWEKVQISVPESDIQSFTYNKGDGILAVYPDRHEYTSNSEFYPSSMSEGIRINGCADDIVYVNNYNRFSITPLSRTAFWLDGELKRCGGAFTPCGNNYCTDIPIVEAIEYPWVLLVPINFDSEYRGDYTMIVEECDRFGNIISGGLYHKWRVVVLCGCDPECWYESIYIDVSGLNDNTYYKVTLGDDDYGWTSASRIIYVKPELQNSVTIQNQTVSSPIQATNNILIKPTSRLIAGFNAKISIDYPDCASGFKSAITEEDKTNCFACMDKGSLSPCDINFSFEELSNTLENDTTNLENEELDLEMDFTVYPNPTETQFTLELLGDESEMSAIEVYNQIGQVIYRKERDIEQKNEIRTEDWSTGVYYVRVVYQQGNVKIKKLVKN